MTAVRCGVCRKPCVPMADYDAPTCVHCDTDMEAVLTRAHMTEIDDFLVTVLTTAPARVELPTHDLTRLTALKRRSA